MLDREPRANEAAAGYGAAENADNAENAENGAENDDNAVG